MGRLALSSLVWALRKDISVRFFFWVRLECFEKGCEMVLDCAFLAFYGEGILYGSYAIVYFFVSSQNWLLILPYALHPKQKPKYNKSTTPE